MVFNGDYCSCSYYKGVSLFQGRIELPSLFPDFFFTRRLGTAMDAALTRTSFFLWKGFSKAQIILGVSTDDGKVCRELNYTHLYVKNKDELKFNR